MTKPTALSLALATLRDAYVVDVRKGDGGVWVVETAIDSPAPLYAGRYALVAAEDMAITMKRIVAGEHALMLAAAMKRDTKRTALKRRG